MDNTLLSRLVHWQLDMMEHANKIRIHQLTTGPFIYHDTGHDDLCKEHARLVQEGKEIEKSLKGET